MLNNRRHWLWIAPAAVWLLFSVWYTDLSGPLTDQEITEGIRLLSRQGRDPERLKALEAFFRADSGRQFFMMNNIDNNDNPPPMPGFDQNATGTDYLNHYMAHLYPQLLARACHPVFYGTSSDGFAADISGIENASGWDSGALIRYRSRRSFLKIITHPDTLPRHDYKLAALTKTIAYPVEADLYLSDPRLLLFLLLSLIALVLDKVFSIRR